MENQNNVIITGSGKVGSGSYNEVKISGSGRILGDIECRLLRVTGSAKSEGNVDAENFSIAGTFKAEKDVRCRKLNITGSFKCDSNIVYAEEIVVAGTLKNDKEISADVIDVTGMIHGREIVGDRININMKRPILSLFTIGSPSNKAETIECTTLEAGYLKCHTISAETIVLVKYSKVDVINCEGTLTIDSTSEVKSINGNCTINRI